jgi:hypothetical protein
MKSLSHFVQDDIKVKTPQFIEDRQNTRRVAVFCFLPSQQKAKRKLPSARPASLR